ncbi:MAG: hypothetical protein RL616_1139, partial [Verrucomicrobiota bacterium]
MVLHSRVSRSKPNVNFTRQIKTLLLRYGVGTVLAVVAGFVVLFSEGTLGSKIIKSSYDLPFVNCGLPFLAPKLTKPDEVAMIWQDEDAFKQLNQLHNTSWDRSIYAQLLDRLTAEGARAVVFDMVFSDTNEKLFTASFNAQFLAGSIQPAMMFLGNLNFVAVAVIGGLRVSS